MIRKPAIIFKSLNKVLFEGHAIPCLGLSPGVIDTRSIKVHTKAVFFFKEYRSILRNTFAVLAERIDELFHGHFAHIYQVESLPTTADNKWELLFAKAWHGLYPVLERIAENWLDDLFYDLPVVKNDQVS